MAKWNTVGAGMTERKVQIDGTFEEFVAAWNAVLPIGRERDWVGDALMRENAKSCRAILQKSDLEDTGLGVTDKQALAAAGAREGSAAWCAAHWLAKYHSYMTCREMIEAGDRSDHVLASLGEAAHEMGRVQEEMRWRSAIDPQTRVAREALARSGRRYRIKSAEGAAKRKAQPSDSTRDVFLEMKRLVANGTSVNAAARITAQRGIGSSRDANRQIWYRQKKAVTDP